MAEFGTVLSIHFCKTMSMKHLTRLSAVIVATGIILSSCGSTQRLNNKEKGAVIGAGGGAVVGGVIGKAAGNNPALGAVIGAAVGGVAGAVIGNRMDKQAEEIKNEVPGVEVERVGEGIVVNFDEKILFKTGESSLSTNAYTSLNNLVSILNKYNQTDLKIYGHTDSDGSEAFNEKLSDKRAESVAAYVASKGLSRSRIITHGYGEMYPKCTNETADGKACNRRVEFAITANEQMKQSAQNEGR